MSPPKATASGQQEQAKLNNNNPNDHRFDSPGQTLDALIAGFGDIDKLARDTAAIHSRLRDLSAQGDDTASRFLSSDVRRHLYAPTFLAQRVAASPDLSDADRLDLWRKAYWSTCAIKDELDLSGLAELAYGPDAGK